ncbi:cyclophilin-like fold protein [Adhaeribacter aerolatus]|nr:cyclophilin-like fold protein [Adhaeribacter aerolatus]
MKHTLVIIFSLLFISASCASCKKEPSAPNNSDTENINGNDNTNPTGSKMKIKIGPSTFSATLLDNPTATAFKALLPLTINMRDLNSNEKFFDFANGLPTNAANPGNIQTGDLMLYGNKTLVLFYKSFSTSYSYTKLGRITDITGLTAALGAGNVTITFELE